MYNTARKEFFKKKKRKQEKKKGNHFFLILHKEKIPSNGLGINKLNTS